MGRRGKVALGRRPRPSSMGGDHPNSQQQEHEVLPYLPENTNTAITRPVWSEFPPQRSCNCRCILPKRVHCSQSHSYRKKAGHPPAQQGQPFPVLSGSMYFACTRLCPPVTQAPESITSAASHLLHAGTCCLLRPLRTQLQFRRGGTLCHAE